MTTPQDLWELLDGARARGVHTFCIERVDIGKVSFTFDAPTAPVPAARAKQDMAAEDPETDPIELALKPPTLEFKESAAHGREVDE